MEGDKRVNGGRNAKLPVRSVCDQETHVTGELARPTQEDRGRAAWRKLNLDSGAPAGGGSFGGPVMGITPWRGLSTHSRGDSRYVPANG